MQRSTESKVLLILGAAGAASMFAIAGWLWTQSSNWYQWRGGIDKSLSSIENRQERAEIRNERNLAEIRALIERGFREVRDDLNSARRRHQTQPHKETPKP